MPDRLPMQDDDGRPVDAPADQLVVAVMAAALAAVQVRDRPGSDPRPLLPAAERLVQYGFDTDAFVALLVAKGYRVGRSANLLTVAT